MSPSAASSRAKTCSLSMSGRVLMSVTGSPRKTRSSGSSAPARRRKVFNTLNTVLFIEEALRLPRRRELLRDGVFACSGERITDSFGEVVGVHGTHLLRHHFSLAPDR